MKKLILIFLMLINIAYANNECKTNIYFANGIMTLKTDAYNNAILLKETILKDIYNNDEKLMDKQINKVEISYNHTQGQIADLLEALIQKINSSYNIEYDYIDKALNFIFGGESPHTKDLKKQIHEYKEALRNKKMGSMELKKIVYQFQ